MIPLGAIAMWSGVLGTIPANWSLCDGTGGTPNLIAKFLRGAPAATDPGNMGGADSTTHASMTAAGGHTHTAQTQTHNHTTNLAGNHNHGAVAAYIDWCGNDPFFSNKASGNHQHTVNNANHTHTMDNPGNHTHTISTDDSRPPFFELAFIQGGVAAAVVANLILIWSGALAAIPAGWTLCDGGGARPDMRSTFVRGVNTNVTDPGGVGGAATHLHTEGNAGLHSHTMNNSGHNAYTWTHSHNRDYACGTTGAFILVQDDSHAGDHTHANTDDVQHNHNAMGNDGTHAHTVNPASSLPAYRDMAFIYNTGGVIIPTGGILIWTGLLANIPLGYSLCDGGGGRPEYRSKFIRGSNAGIDPGGIGGSDTHTHTDQNDGDHNAHTMVNTGAHTHAATDTIGAHTHSTRNEDYDADSQTRTNNASGGDHSHTYNNENNHTHTLTSPGDHTHNNWSTDDGRPAYYEVAFIYKA